MLTLRVCKGSEGSNPSLPAAQAAVDMSRMSTEDLAWAAGLFEGEGTVSGYWRKDRPSRAVQLTLYEGTHHGAPSLLERFRDAVGAGSIVGPYRGRLYHWTTKRIASVESVSTLLWADLSAERRRQFVTAFSGTARWEDLAARLDALQSSPIGVSRARELAWAAGFFDGEGSVLATRGGTAPPRLYLPQASTEDEPHTALLRFHRAVGGQGRISGPRYLPDAWSKRPQWRWEATSFEVVQSVVAMLWSHLGRVKRAEAQAAFATYLEHRRLRRPRGVAT